ncbi:MAG: DNA-processing protein DprA [Crocinitomicaceae bacterium]|nr:DNA-processing protein DprA [Crocinitomicaceae bacterium]
MNYTYRHYQISLTLLNGVGTKRARIISNLFPDLEIFFNLPVKQLHAQTGFTTRFLKQLNRKKALRQSEEVISFIQKRQIQILFYTDIDYPRRLLNCPDAPLILYFLGNCTFNDLQFVSIVGTRACTEYGANICRELVSTLNPEQTVIVSGLALGVDTMAHTHALEFGIPTIGVLGHGLDRIYPSQNRELAKKMTKTGGLLTEFIPGTAPDRENFPKRNRIVAGLCDATIVIESATKGGSIITAELANDYNRDVFAYPGSVYAKSSSGCNSLIRSQKAHLISCGNDFIKIMNWNSTEGAPSSNPPTLFHDLNDLQQKILNQLSVKPLPIDLIAQRASIPISALNTELFHLEMENLVRQLPGRTYCLIR